ncbi:MAG: hypothetical protein PVJ15_07215 [Gammaproteobacteria bacterium]|jgi:hypothetical protein
MSEAGDEMDLEKARLDPGSVFASPEQLCESPGLSREQKIDLLQRWAEDARELEVAEEEGMGGGESSLLSRILTALDSLG